MELTVKVDFWFDGIDDVIYEEIKNYLTTAIESGAEATCCEIEVKSIQI